MRRFLGGRGRPLELVAAFGAIVMLTSTGAEAEPYLSVRSGLKCMSCHTNPSGGGRRNAFGNAYAQGELAQRRIGASENIWTGDINRWLGVGADLRAGYDYVDIPNAEEQDEFGVERGTVYGELRAIPGLLSIYFDERIAPDSATNREAYALITPAEGRYTIKVGKFFLPFGWRLQDDSALTRRFTGINFNTPDNGVELGIETSRWTAQIALTNGSAGAPENDTSKQTSLRGAYVTSRWQIGASFNFNDSALGDRTMAGVFAGLQTGPITWLAELDHVSDEMPGGDQEMIVGLLEGNWQLGRGHNLKLSLEAMNPYDDREEQERVSLVWEYAPFQMLQPRVGIRVYDGVDTIDFQNRDEFFAELHVFF